MLIDFSLVAVVLLFGALGYRKGFSAMAVSFLALGLSALLTFFIYDAVYDRLLKTSYGQKAEAAIVQNVEQHIDIINADKSDSMPFVKMVLSLSDKDGEKSLNERASEKISKLLISVIVLVITYILAKLIVFGIKRAVIGAAKLPVLHIADSMLGFSCGILFGAVWAAVIYLSLGYIIVASDNTFISEQYNSSALVLLIADIMGIWGGI